MPLRLSGGFRKAEIAKSVADALDDVRQWCYRPDSHSRISASRAPEATMLALQLVLANAGASPEILDNDLDDDGDGLIDVIRRPFSDGRFAVGGQWLFSSGTIPATDTADLLAGQSMSLRAPLPWSGGDVHVGIYVKGFLGSVVPSCHVTLDTSVSPPSTAAAPLTLGWNDVAWAGSGKFNIDLLKIDCTSGGGVLRVDWVTLQNAEYEWAPVSDLTLDVDDAGLAGGGQNTVIVRGSGAVGCWAAADLGGVAWSSDCATWNTVNGADGDMHSEATLGVWDVYPMSDEFAFAVAGRSEPGDPDPVGALQYSDDMGEHWNVIPMPDGDLFGVNRDIDECRARGFAGKTALSRGGGRLIEGWSSETEWLFVVNHANSYVGGSPVRNRDIYLVEATDSLGGVSYDTFEIEGDVFTYASLSGEKPLSEMEGDASRNGKYFGALKVVDWGDGNASLFAGVKTGAPGRSLDDQSLFRCDFDQAALEAALAGTRILCEEVAGGQDLDVRDIEYVEDVDDPGSGLLLVADGGRRYLNGGLVGGSGDCDHEEGQVWALSVSAAATSALWPLDGTTAPSRACASGGTTTDPAWNSWQCLASYNKQHPAGTGDIRFPGDTAGLFDYDGGELTGITVLDAAITQDSDGNGAVDRAVIPIVAFIDAPKSSSDIYPRVYKAEIILDTNLSNGRQDVFDVAVTDTLSWTPLWDFYSNEGWNPLSGGGTNPYNDAAPAPYNRAQRVNAILAVAGDAADTWPYDQMSLDTWLPAWTIDGLPVDGGEAGTAPDLLVSSGYGMYRVLSGASAQSYTLNEGAHVGAPLCVGWDSAYGFDYDCGDGAYVDLDYMPWKFAMPRAADDVNTFDFGMTVAQDLWFCAGCDEGDNDGEGYYTTDDIGAAFFHGPPLAGGSRAAADVDCHFDAWGEGGLAVDGVEVVGDQGVVGSALWMSVGPQTAGGTTGQALFRKAADGTWCFMTTEQTLTLMPRSEYTEVRGGFMKHSCKWEPVTPPTGYWGPCDGSVSGIALSDEHYGRPTSVAMGVQYSQAIAPFFRVDPMDEVAVVAFRHDPDADPAATDNTGGLAVLHTDTSASPEVTTIDAIPFGADDRGACTVPSEEVLFSDTPRIDLDALRSWYMGQFEYHLELYLGLWGARGAGSDDCALWSVTDELVGGVRTTTWTSIPLDPLARACPLSHTSLNGVRTSEWAPGTVFAFGGYNGTGAVCAIGGSLPEVAYAGSLIVRDVAPHPHLSNTLVVGTKWKYTESGQANLPGIQVAALRRDLNTGIDAWVKAHMDTEALENPDVEALDWAAYPDYTTELYIGSHGSGPLSAAFTWF